MNQQDKSFLTTFTGVMAILVVLAAVIFLVAQLIGKLNRPADDGSRMQAQAEDRIKPVARVAVADPNKKPVKLSAKDIVTQVCSSCHGAGVLGAPKIGNAEDWTPRVAQGLDTLVSHAVNGFKGMPAKGGMATLSDADIRSAVIYMLKDSGVKLDAAKADAGTLTIEGEKGLKVVIGLRKSGDDTWATIQQVAASHSTHFRIKTGQQPGKGKYDAVRMGFDMAEGDILMILDADLTVPPEDLPKFYYAIASGTGDFINGTRLVYPMEKEAMRFLNMIGNRFFSVMFSWLLGQHFTDTLCGTKVMFRSDYKRLVANRKFFGDFDPFGDFDLLFGASKLNLKILEVPVRYRNRSYDAKPWLKNVSQKVQSRASLFGAQYRSCQQELSRGGWFW